MAELLDLDGEVLGSYWTDAISWVRQAAANAEPRRILDLGAGTGVGTVELARHFVDAQIIAMDASEEMLGRIRAKADDLRLTHRVRTVQADLDADWPALDAVDVTWASMSLHHLADPDRVVRDVFATTRPGGVLAVAEISEPLRFLPHDLGFGQPGLEARLSDVRSEAHAHALPDLGSHWSPRLAAAGFTVLSERDFVIDLQPPPQSPAARYAQRWLRRLAPGLAHQLTDDDLQALAVLLDGQGPDSVQRRGDLHVHGTRTVTLARRP